MKKAKYIIMLLLLALVSGILFYQITKEDTLSEPTLKVYVKGMDTGDYWLDLLIDDDAMDYQRLYSDRILEAVAVLKEYEDEEGYRPAMLGGSEQKFIGRFDGSWQKDESYRHEFWGVGIPDEFKVAILTRDDKLIVSGLVKTKTYHSKVRFDIDETNFVDGVASGVGQIKETMPWSRIVFGFFIRLLAAIIIKMSIAEAFGFKSKRSVGVLLKTTLITQTVLNLSLITQIFYGAKFATTVFIAGSLVVLAAEVIVYSVFLEEKNKRMRIINALVANAASAVVGYSLIYFIEWVVL